MRIFFYFLIILTLPAGRLSAQGAMQRQIEALLGDKLLQSSDVSVAVYSLTAGKMLYTHRQHKMCRPASTEKLITTVAALSATGCDYTLDTELRFTGHLTADSTLHGDLYVVGGFDPVFGEADLCALVGTLRRQGIARIEGGVVGDVSLCDSLYWGEGWCWDDTPYSQQPYLSPLMINRGCVKVSVSPAAAGEPPTVQCSPRSRFYTIENRALSHQSGAGKFSILRDWIENSNRIVVSGNCTAPQSTEMNLYRSQHFFMQALLERLDSAGIGWNGATWGAAPPQAQLLARISRPVEEVVQPALTESENACAEALLIHLAAQGGNRHVGYAQGSQRVTQFIRDNFPEEKNFRIADGSGLSLYNYVSASLMLKILNYAYRQPPIYQMLQRTLPRAGESGTLKSRMAGRPVWAKTGTVTGASTLAGYMLTKQGELLSFVIFNQGTLKASEARAWQNRLCEILYNN